MPVREFWFTTTAGEKRFAREWPAEKAHRGNVIIIHGLADHSGRFHDVAGFLNRHGYSVFSFDLEGNGKSPGKRGHFISLEKVFSEIGQFIQYVKNQDQGLHLFLYGQSMGGNLVINYGIRFNPAIKGIISSSPWLKLTSLPSRMTIAMARLIHLIYPSFLQPNGLIAGDLSHDPEITTAYANDPFVHGRISVRTFFLIVSAGEFALRHAEELKLPLLLMHGTADRITSFKASRSFAAALKNRVSFKAWEGLYHELHNEFNREEILNFVVQWMEEEAIFRD